MMASRGAKLANDLTGAAGVSSTTDAGTSAGVAGQEITLVPAGDRRLATQAPTLLTSPARRASQAGLPSAAVPLTLAGLLLIAAVRRRLRPSLIAPADIPRGLRLIRI